MSFILQIKDLSIEFPSRTKRVQAVRNLNLDIPRGKTLGLVGESGSGKSVTSLSIMRLLNTPPAQVTSGEILFEDEDLLSMSEKSIRKIRGNRIAMIFQEPMTSLNPVFTIGYQVMESLLVHNRFSKKEAREKSIDLLDQVGIPNPRQRIRSYPHELSGGQRQRVMIAMAISCQPDLLIADEPTTALDVTIQKQILELLAKLQSDLGMGLLFITHDLAVVAEIADEVAVMRKGLLVEKGPVKSIFEDPSHPYTRGLIACRPKLDQNFDRLPTVKDFLSEDGQAIDFDETNLGVRVPKSVSDGGEPLLKILQLKKHFPIKKGFLGGIHSYNKAVDGVDLSVWRGRTLGLVGESGCGKTTLGRSLLRLIEPTSGEVFFDGKNILKLSSSEMRALRRRMQIVFQDPYASLNPRMTVGAAIMEPMIIHRLASSGAERLKKAEALMERVGLETEYLSRYPHEFSGGQRQRICIARALAVEPEFIVCDESVSALDVSVQAQILNLLLDLQKDMGLTYIFISHDLAVVKFFADEVAVMNAGVIVEQATAEKIYNSPQNDYTKKLLSSIPKGISV